MHGMNNAIVINSQQARIIHHYKHIEEKLLTTNAAISTVESGVGTKREDSNL